MAANDSINILPDTGVTKAIALDNVGGIEYQAVKIALGLDAAIDTLLDSGQQTMANSVPVVLASNQTAVPVDGSAVTQPVSGTITINDPSVSAATLSNVSGSASSVTLLASNASRKKAILFNDSTAALYLKYGASASTSSFTYKIFSNGMWEMPTPIYTGLIAGIWDSATGNARVTEL